MNKLFVFTLFLLFSFNPNFAMQENLHIPDGTEFVDDIEMEVVEQTLDDNVDDFCLDVDDDYDDILDDIDPVEIEGLVEKPTFKQKMAALGALIKVKMNGFKEHIKGNKTAYGVGGGISCASLILGASILGVYLGKRNSSNDKDGKPKNK